MVDHDTHILDCGVHTSTLASRASDHLPVWANVELTGKAR
jgi:endonuclease/exonuclease/phosphatase family metal-dependent hydrolase